ncbi:hypothetical protein SLE2022_329220 [Rubroshorea leprosula]
MIPFLASHMVHAVTTTESDQLSPTLSLMAYQKQAEEENGCICRTNKVKAPTPGKAASQVDKLSYMMLEHDSSSSGSLSAPLI